MNGNPTAEQKRLHDWCRNRNCVVGFGQCDSIHHIKGSKMKLKGVKNAGDWYVLPISYWWHQDGNNKNAIHINKSNFVKVNGKNEKDFWLGLMSDYYFCFGKYPMSKQEYQIIVDRA